MFGIGFTEMALVGVLFLLFFGPEKLPQMARDAGSFIGKAQSTMDEFKAELALGGEDAPGRKDGLTTRRDKELDKGKHLGEGVASTATRTGGKTL